MDSKTKTGVAIAAVAAGAVLLFSGSSKAAPKPSQKTSPPAPRAPVNQPIVAPVNPFQPSPDAPPDDDASHVHSFDMGPQAGVVTWDDRGAAPFEDVKGKPKPAPVASSDPATDDVGGDDPSSFTAGFPRAGYSRVFV